MSGRKLVNNEWWEIAPKSAGIFNVVNTHIKSDVVGGGVANIEIMRPFDNEKEAVIFLETQIAFVRDITLPSQDGISLLYIKGDDEITVSISGTALGVWGFSREDSKSLLEEMSFQPLIQTFYGELKNAEVKKIDITSDTVEIDGKIIYQTKDCKSICK